MPPLRVCVWVLWGVLCREGKGQSVGYQWVRLLAWVEGALARPVLL